jgi:hypothetical protein
MLYLLLKVLVCVTSANVTPGRRPKKATPKGETKKAEKS